MKKKSVFLAVALLFALCMAGCASTGSGTAALYGVWVPEKGQSIPDNFIEERLELSKDGTGMFESYANITWTAENGRLKLIIENDLELEYSYKLSGS